MAHSVAIINGKKPDVSDVGGVRDDDLSQVAVHFLTRGVFTPASYKVEEQDTPDMTVKVGAGRAYVPSPSGDMFYATYLDTETSPTISNNSSGNDRIDAVVIKVDTTTTPDKFAENIASIVVVEGTPAASPSAPSDSEVQTDVGAGNAFLRLANVTVANGAASITNSDISDTRQSAALHLPEHSTEPDTPDTGTQFLYFKSDGKLYQKDDAGTETAVGGGSTTTNKARAYCSTNQSIPNTTYTKIQLDTESFDPGGNFDSSTNYRFTAPVDGYYQINAAVTIDNFGDGKRMILRPEKNGGLYAEVINIGGAVKDLSATFADVVQLSATDYFELVIWHEDGSSVNLVGGSARTFMSVHLLST